jgi:hypothetical protein
MTAGSAVTRGRLREELAEAQREQHRRRYLEDPWAWVSECCFTVDELDAVHPIKPFPVAACVSCRKYLGHADREKCPQCGEPPKPMAYLEHLTRTWWKADPNILIVAKSRRMMLSWLFCALHTYLAWRQPHAKVFICSDSEKKSAELLDRCQGLLERLPEDRCARPKLHRTIAPPVLTFEETGAMIYGIPEGSEALRQYTASAILADEFAHWAWPRASYTAFKPCVDGGGRLTLLSSAAPGFFAELIRGEILG